MVLVCFSDVYDLTHCKKTFGNVSVYMKMPFQTSEGEAHNHSFISVIQVNKLVFVCLYELSTKKTFTLQIC